MGAGTAKGICFYFGFLEDKGRLLKVLKNPLMVVLDIIRIKIHYVKGENKWESSG